MGKSSQPLCSRRAEEALTKMGYRIILTLSGVSKREDLTKYAFTPDLVVNSVRDIEFSLSWWLAPDNTKKEEKVLLTNEA